MKRINCERSPTTANINPMQHLQSPQFLRLPLSTSRCLRRSSLLCSGVGDSLRKLPKLCYSYGSPILRRSERIVAFVGKEETEDGGGDEIAGAKEDLEYVRKIQRVLELLKKNRDMLFSDLNHAKLVMTILLVRLTIMIEDAREVERRKLLGIEDPDAPTRDDLVLALEQVNEGKIPEDRIALWMLAEELNQWPNLKVNEGKIPEDRIALWMLAEELNQWPNLEVETTKKKPSKSLYAKATDTGVDPKAAAKRLNIDWDTPAEI